MGVVLARFHGVGPLRDDLGQIVGMNDASGRPALHILLRHSEVVEKRSIHEFDFAFRSRREDQTGNAVNEQSKALFARPQRLLGLLAIVDIGRSHIPLDGRFAEMTAAEEEPAIDAVGVANARFDFARARV